MTHSPTGDGRSVYAAAYDIFREELFTAEDAGRRLGYRRTGTLRVIRGLRRRLLLANFDRSRYRLLGPADAEFAAGRMLNLSRAKPGCYLHLMVKAVRMMASHFGDRLVSVCLYGSVARGEARANSDVDLLVVLEKLDGGPVHALRTVYGCLEDLRLERRFLLRHGVATDVSIYPLAREEARRFHPIYLDVAEDGIVLYDVGGFFAHLQFQAVGTLINSGGVKVRSRGEWFWRMPKDFVFGEPIGLPSAR